MSDEVSLLIILAVLGWGFCGAVTFMHLLERKLLLTMISNYEKQIEKLAPSEESSRLCEVIKGMERTTRPACKDCFVTYAEFGVPFEPTEGEKTMDFYCKNCVTKHAKSDFFDFRLCKFIKVQE